MKGCCSELWAAGKTGAAEMEGAGVTFRLAHAHAQEPDRLLTYVLKELAKGILQWLAGVGMAGRTFFKDQADLPASRRSAAPYTIFCQGENVSGDWKQRIAGLTMRAGMTGG